MTLIQKSGSKFSLGPYLVLMAAVVKKLCTKAHRTTSKNQTLPALSESILQRSFAKILLVNFHYPSCQSVIHTK